MCLCYYDEDSDKVVGKLVLRIFYVFYVIGVIKGYYVFE